MKLEPRRRREERSSYRHEGPPALRKHPGCRPNANSFIKANMQVRAAPELPELRLYAAQPTSGLWRLADPENDLPPYWAYDWAGGTVLARHILDHPETVAGLRVLDLGAGSAVVAIAAAKAGAGEVIAADIDENAIAAAQLNAELNDVNIVTVHADITTGPPPPVDLILCGDVFYDKALAGKMATFLDACIKADIRVLVGDPGRLHLPRSRLRLVAEYAMRDFGDAVGAPSKQASVFLFGPRDEIKY